MSDKVKVAIVGLVFGAEFIPTIRTEDSSMRLKVTD